MNEADLYMEIRDLKQKLEWSESERRFAWGALVSVLFLELIFLLAWRLS